MKNKTIIIPALPDWYACDPNLNDDFTACVSISYEPIIAWAITECEDYTLTIPIFSTGGPAETLTLPVTDDCCNLFYKQPNGKFRAFQVHCDTEQQVMNNYTAMLKK